MVRNFKFIECFQNIGASWSLLPDIALTENYVCKLYGSKLKTVNQLSFMEEKKSFKFFVILGKLVFKIHENQMTNALNLVVFKIN